jgi:WD40 repeat protein
MLFNCSAPPQDEEAAMPLLGSASTDGTIKVWDLSDPRKPIASATNERCELRVLAFGFEFARF